jgi:hypothetical protein
MIVVRPHGRTAIWQFTDQIMPLRIEVVHPPCRWDNAGHQGW